MQAIAPSGTLKSVIQIILPFIISMFRVSAPHLISSEIEGGRANEGKLMDCVQWNKFTIVRVLVGRQ